MRWSYFIVLQVLLIVIVGAVVYSHKDRVRLVKTPPASLAQWYKPDNKRQVWLHTMFNLRREMQAILTYSDTNNAKHLEKWAGRLSEHYLKIGEMVPEWKKKLDMDAIASLQEGVKSHSHQDISYALDKLTESCDSCHADYRAVTATMYRAPDFSLAKIGPSISLVTHMEDLVRQVNQIKIASEDGMADIALSSLSDLNKGISTLGDTCSNCHEKDPQVYPGHAIKKTIAELGESLKTGTLKQQGRALGALAVQACARCHGTHRLAYDASNVFSDGQSWRELIKH